MNQPCVEKPGGRLLLPVDGAVTFIRELCAPVRLDRMQYPYEARRFDGVHPDQRPRLAGGHEARVCIESFGRLTRVRCSTVLRGCWFLRHRSFGPSPAPKRVVVAVESEPLDIKVLPGRGAGHA